MATGLDGGVTFHAWHSNQATAAVVTVAAFRQLLFQDGIEDVNEAMDALTADNSMIRTGRGIYWVTFASPSFVPIPAVYSAAHPTVEIVVAGAIGSSVMVASSTIVVKGKKKKP